MMVSLVLVFCSGFSSFFLQSVVILFAGICVLWVLVGC